MLDVGCGTGVLWGHLRRPVRLVRRGRRRPVRRVPGGRGVPGGRHRHRAGALPDGCADAVVAVETIEHVENPRAFVRELTRLARPGGLVVVTTPNQLSLLSLLTLVTKGQFNAFEEAPGLYPATSRRCWRPTCCGSPASAA